MNAAPATAGYSGTPLATKLGFKHGMRAAFVALPTELRELTAAVDFAATDTFDSWADVAGKPGAHDVIHAFTKHRAEIEDHLEDLQGAINRHGTIWASWPKKASKVPTDVTEDVIRAAALKLDLVDVKVVAIDDIWSGLKLVMRKERR